MIDNYLIWRALVGGMLIGLSATLLYLGSGRIAGISGIAGGLFSTTGDERGWRWRFLLGLLGGGALVKVLGGAVALEFRSSWLLTLVAGLLVGYGTRLGSGCTSGHGVCGLARLSRRSLAALVVFMGVAVLTVLVLSLLREVAL
ncbi:MAG: YeeE/YedE family protein [Pseudomonadales bacterium]|jgi:uncharacterized membrane protein YedE/YeeE|nr:YeeE/YedE family protein [Pseudomonadales bacterium]